MNRDNYDEKSKSFKSGFRYGFDKDSGFLAYQNTMGLDNIIERSYMQIVQLKDEKMKECIVALGYTPPKGELNISAATTLKKYQVLVEKLEKENKQLKLELKNE